MKKLFALYQELALEFFETWHDDKGEAVIMAAIGFLATIVCLFVIFVVVCLFIVFPWVMLGIVLFLALFLFFCYVTYRIGKKIQ